MLRRAAALTPEGEGAGCDGDGLVASAAVESLRFLRFRESTKALSYRGVFIVYPVKKILTDLTWIKKFERNFSILL